MEKNGNGISVRGSFACALFCLALCGMLSCSARSSPKEILFIGHSYFFCNDLPGLVEAIATGENKKVAVLDSSYANFTIVRHLSDKQTQKHLIERKWDTAIFTDFPGYMMADDRVEREILPSWIEFKEKLNMLGIDEIYVMDNWAYRTGMVSTVYYRTYETMQPKMTENYARTAETAEIPLIPVGSAWLEFYHRHSDFKLWTADGIHPSPTGSYLAACVIYCSLFHEPIKNLSAAPSWIDPTLAKEIHGIAYAVSETGRGPE